MMVTKMLMWLWVMLVLAGECYGCLEQERIALLQIKDYIYHSNGNSLPTWEDALVGEETSDCCEWERVKCNAVTRRVIQLSLNYTSDDWELGDWYLNASMFLPFQGLESLDLSSNNFVGCLENEGFERLAMLRNLEDLDLSRNRFNNSILSTLVGLTSLKSLRLSGNNLNGTFYINDFESLSMLRNLEDLDLSGNSFNNSILSSLGGLTSLKSLRLSGNNLNGTFCIDDLKGLKNLKELDISWNELHSFTTHPGFESLAMMRNLEDLDLSYNSFNNSILSTLGRLTSLKSLKLHHSGLKGALYVDDLKGLKNLKVLDISSNELHSFTTYPGMKTRQLKY